MQKWKYLFVGGDLTVSGTDDKDEAVALAADGVVIEVSEAGVQQLDEDGDAVEIAGL